MRSSIAWASAALIVCGLTLFVDAQIAQVPTGTWVPAPQSAMSSPRASASAVQLADGRVLITGGVAGNVDAPQTLASAEIFDRNGAFMAAAEMQTPRSGHASVRLLDGRVLVTGGITSDGTTTATAEIYDPATDAWSSAGSMLEARAGHTTSLMGNGRVLIADGATLEIYDPAAGMFLFAGNFSPARTGHAAAALPDGRVVIAGGQSENGTVAYVDVYEDGVGLIALNDMGTPRSNFSATTLLDGRVLFAGGHNADGDLASAEILDPHTGSVTPATSSLAVARSSHLAFLLPNNNNVLIVGGMSAGATLSSTELYSPWRDRFSMTGPLSAARASAIGSPLLQDGLLLAAGGTNFSGHQDGAELYGFATVKTDKSDYAPGEMVTISGSGWRPGETVSLKLQEVPDLDEHPLLDVVADAAGNIVSTEFSPDEHDLNIRFFLTARGSQFEAQTTFTDGRTITSATLNGATSVSVAGAASITAVVNVTTDNGGGNQNWRSTGWSIATTPPGAVTCFNNPNHDGSGNYSETFTITAPATPGTYNAYFIAYSDDACGNQASTTFTLTNSVHVNATNTAPVLGAIGNKTASEGNPLTFTASATDTDTPAQTLTFSLDAGAPSGAVINSSTGAFSWTPSEAQGPGSYSVTVRVTDSGTPAMSDTETITITVSEVNEAPVLAAIGNKTIDEGSLLTFTATATDPDIPANTLTFSLDAGAPSGAAITAAGVFTWTPSEAQGPGSYPVTVRVTDNGSPALNDFETITVTVNEANAAPVLASIGNKSVNEGTLLTFTASATDSDVPANTLTYSLDAGFPAGASIDPTTGVFSWTPTEAQGPNTYSVTVRATDNGSPSKSAFETITITVNEANAAPVLNAISNQTVDEGTLLTVTALATDSDIPANTLTYSLDAGAPSGASINATTGVLNWTPTEAQGPGSYSITVRVTDNGSPVLDDHKTFTVTVNEVNVAPVLAPIASKTVDEETLLTFTASATDADLPANTLTYSLDAGAPVGAAIDPSTGVFTWTPTEAQGPGSYSVTVRVKDNGSPILDDSKTLGITVNEVNAAPVLGSIGNKSVDEETLLTFTASATDSDMPANTLTYSLDAGAPVGASINGSTGVFTWTPTEAQGPGSYTVTVRVKDNGTPVLEDFETISITVNEVNAAPVLAPIGNKTVDEQTLLTFTASATDPDMPANALTYSLEGAPAGASINPMTGVFTWTPTEAQGPGTYDVTVKVTDDGTPNLSDFELIQITVNEVNVAPELAPIGNKTVDEETLLTFTASATDVDLPANTLTYSLDAGSPTGAAINSSTGVFTWTPTEAQGPGIYSITVRVTDNGSPTLADFETITVDVKEVNAAPELAHIGDQSIDEAQLFTFTATATDSDIPANTLTFSLDAGAPAGASITSAGVFTWTPTEAQGPGTYPVTVRVKDNGSPVLDDFETFMITVKEVNVAPVLDGIGNKTVNEETTLSFTATATDTDIPANTLSFSLDAGAPAGASIDPTTGLFTWTPTEAQGPGTYSVSIRVTDNGSPALSDCETITITVNEVNVAPVLASIGNHTINEEEPFTLTASATDHDIPANALTYSLIGAPAGASIDPATGIFSWTPSEAQGPGSFTFTVQVTDDGNPPMSDSETITIIVNEVNAAPVLDPIGNKTVNELSLLSFTATAMDHDLPPNPLTFSLDSGAPAGASITAAGLFTWTPTEAQGPGVYPVTVRVTDGGTPALDDSETFTITVNEVNVAPVLGAIGNKMVDEETLLTFTATATDADVPANTLTYSLDAPAPSGAAINPSTGVFTWTPTEAQGPNVYSVTVRVTDNGIPALDDYETFNITVKEVNVAPVLAPIGNKTVDEQTLLTFTATASDHDLPPNTLTFSLDPGAPAGAAISSAGVFTWTPTEAQGPGTYSVTVRVKDDGSPAMSASETIMIAVNEVNVAPVLGAIGNKAVLLGNTLTFAATATDSDLPANVLTYSLVGAPAGASINPISGAFSWTPTPAQIGSHSFTVKVTDNGVPSLSDSEVIMVDVNYGVCALFDQDKSVKRNSTLPVKIYLCDSNQNDVSAPSIVVQATSLVPIGPASSAILEDSGNANPDLNFRYTGIGPSNGGGYLFNMSTKGIPAAKWQLLFTVDGVAAPNYFVTFSVR